MPFPLLALLPLLTELGGKIAGNLFPDPAEETKREQFKQNFQLQVQTNMQQFELAVAGIIKAEAQSVHWLTANWRPITMLTFVGLVVARWMGWTAPGMTEAEYLSIYDLIKIGLGGYVVGRSLEKLAPSIAAALKKG